MDLPGGEGREGLGGGGGQGGGECRQGVVNSASASLSKTSRTHFSQPGEEKCGSRVPESTLSKPRPAA